MISEVAVNSSAGHLSVHQHSSAGVCENRKPLVSLAIKGSRSFKNMQLVARWRCFHATNSKKEVHDSVAVLGHAKITSVKYGMTRSAQLASNYLCLSFMKL